MTVEGAGVHWQCLAGRGERQVRIHCFDAGGPQYLTGFGTADPGDVRAWGRTRSEPETVAAAADWLEGRDVASLRDRFAFVDATQRALAAIQAESIALEPALGRQAAPLLRQVISDLFDLRFDAGDRSARISFHGENLEPDTVLCWDGHPMARVRIGDTPRRAALLARWLCDRLMPSALAANFPEVEVDPAARWYEDGRPVEGEFLLSWDAVEEFYRGCGLAHTDAVLGLVAAIRRAGWERALRAGQSMFTLVLSRSRRHGLRDGQPWLGLDFLGDGRMTVRGHAGGEIEATFPRVAYSPELEDLLQRLAACPVDGFANPSIIAGF